MENKSKIQITSPARLHLGFMDLNGSLGRKFGSVGLAIDSIETSITVSKNSLQNSLEHNDSNKRAYAYADLILKAYELDESVSIDVHRKIPEHAGLGSGTQLGLSFHYIEQPKPQGLAQAFVLGKKFIGSDDVCLVLGDNIIYGQGLSGQLEKSIQSLVDSGVENIDDAQ